MLLEKVKHIHSNMLFLDIRKVFFLLIDTHTVPVHFTTVSYIQIGKTSSVKCVWLKSFSSILYWFAFWIKNCRSTSYAARMVIRLNGFYDATDIVEKSLHLWNSNYYPTMFFIWLLFKNELNKKLTDNVFSYFEKIDKLLIYAFYNKFERYKIKY